MYSSVWRERRQNATPGLYSHNWGAPPPRPAIEHRLGSASRAPRLARQESAAGGAPAECHALLYSQTDQRHAAHTYRAQLAGSAALSYIAKAVPPAGCRAAHNYIVQPAGSAAHSYIAQAAAAAGCLAQAAAVQGKAAVVSAAAGVVAAAVAARSMGAGRAPRRAEQHRLGGVPAGAPRTD